MSVTFILKTTCTEPKGHWWVYISKYTSVMSEGEKDENKARQVRTTCIKKKTRSAQGHIAADNIFHAANQCGERVIRCGYYVGQIFPASYAQERISSKPGCNSLSLHRDWHVGGFR